MFALLLSNWFSRGLFESKAILHELLIGSILLPLITRCNELLYKRKALVFNHKTFVTKPAGLYISVVILATCAVFGRTKKAKNHD